MLGINKEEFLKEVSQEELYELWEKQYERNRINQNKIICLESRLESAVKEAEKYRKFWRDELRKEDEDRLAELERLILKCYLARGYKLFKDQLEGDKQWYFGVIISTLHKQKEISILGFEDGKQTLLFYKKSESTKDMFESAIEHYTKLLKPMGGLYPSMILIDDIEKNKDE